MTQEHTISTTNLSDGKVKVTCTCGWFDRWSVRDGSAQQSGAEHVRWAKFREAQSAPQER